MNNLLITAPRSQSREATWKFAPSKLTGWHIERRPSNSLDQTVRIPDVALVGVGAGTRATELKAIISDLADIQAKAPLGCYVLFSFPDDPRVTEGPAHASRPVSHGRRHVAHGRRRGVSGLAGQIVRELATFPNPQLVDVVFTGTHSVLETKLNHIRAKLKLNRKVIETCQSNIAPRPSPIDRVQSVVKATEDLRMTNGRLSAERIAPAFGISLNQLATWLGRSRQAISKTPAADSIQDELSFFERVARLRSVLSPGAFRKWLRMPNSQIDDKTPLELLAAGERQVMADLVDDMLTGAPA